MKSPGPDARTSTRPFLTRIAPPVRRAPIAFVCCAILLTACHSHEAPAPELQPVVALAIHADNGAVQRVLPAQVQARYSTPLSFRVGGKIVERRVRIGDTVKAGQAVAMLDPADLRNTLLNARAQLDAAEHRVAYAKQQLDRDRAQAQANLIAPAQLETTQDAYASAVAQRDSALAQMALAGMFAAPLVSPSLQLWLIGASAVGFDLGVQIALVAHQTIVYGIDPAARSRLNAVLFVSMFTGMAAGAALGSVALSGFGWIGVTALATASALGAVGVRMIAARR